MSLRVSAAQELLSRKKAEESFYEFVKQAWPYAVGNKPFIDGWHIGAICEHLEAVNRREIKNLLINIPPRCGKSNIVSVLWPAFSWIHEPIEQFLFASYAERLSSRDSRNCRLLIESNWYQARWGHLYNLVEKNKLKFDNNLKGYRIATSVGGSATGEGGSVLVSDDANNAKDGESEAEKESTLDWWDSVWQTRLNNINTGVFVNIQQRLDARDVSGHILSHDECGDWVRLILPMEFEVSRRAKTIILPSTKGKVWQDPRKKEGEILWPGMFGDGGLERLKHNLKSEYRIAGQLQQRPSPASGGIIKKDYFSIWKRQSTPDIEHTIQSWDTALEAGDKNAYSACTTWGIFYDHNNISNLILLSLWRGKVEYPELRQIAKSLYRDYRDDGNVEISIDGNHVPDVVLVEAKVSGISLIQDLQRAGISAFRFDPNKYGDKIQRVRLITHLLEAGRVWLPAKPPDFTQLRPFADLFCEECMVFPNGESRDLVDTMTQCLLRLNASGWLSHPSDDDRSDTSVKGIRIN